MAWNGLRLALAAMMLLFGASFGHAEPGNPEGRWALHAAGRTLMILELSRNPSAPGGLSGQLVLPERLEMSGSRAPGSHVFYGIKGPVVRRAIRNTVRHEGEYELSMESRRDGKMDTYTFRVAGDGSGELAYSNVPLAPFVFVRAAPGEAVTETWDTERSYAVDWERPSNPEMTAIFAADQKWRLDTKIEWDVVRRADRERRARTQALLDAGALQSGDDFYHAAFVFQHGEQPSDYLMAHTLAMIAIARGRRSATWIAAATLDRYLQDIGQKQVFGTQYGAPAKGFTQEPYDRTLVSDALRTAIGVPPLAEQEAERAQMEARPRPAK